MEDAGDVTSTTTTVLYPVSPLYSLLHCAVADLCQNIPAALVYSDSERYTSRAVELYYHNRSRFYTSRNGAVGAF